MKALFFLIIFLCCSTLSTLANDSTKTKEILTIVEQKPEFVGGQIALQKYLADSIVYPIEALDQNIMGTVVIRFIVYKDGSMGDFKILKDIGGGCGQEALRVIQSMPKWKSAYEQNQPIDFSFYIPVKFVINDKDASFPGGKTALNTFIENTLIKPKEVIENNLKGKVGFTIFIDDEGNITKYKLLYNTLKLSSMSKSAEKVIKLMPKWNPEIRKGKKVASQQILNFEI